jgi:hypothetical protein
MLHFTSNLEYYIKTRAIQSICNELANQLKEIEETEKCDKMSGGKTDMDNLVTIHEEFMSKIIKLCLLDSKSKNFLDLILNILQVSLDFRALVKKYLIPFQSNDSSDEDEVSDK